MSLGLLMIKQLLRQCLLKFSPAQVFSAMDMCMHDWQNNIQVQQGACLGWDRAMSAKQQSSSHAQST